MDKTIDEQSTPHVCTETGPQLTLFHLTGLLTSFTGAMIGCKYGFRHGGFLFAAGGTVTGFLIGFALCVPITFLFALMLSIPQFVASAIRGIGQNVLRIGRDR